MTSSISRVNLTFWSVIEVSQNNKITRHFVGLPVDSLVGQVSSAIQEFDPNKMVGITNSGREYALVGHPGSCSQSARSLGLWLENNKVDKSAYSDVTSEYFFRN